MEEWKTYKLSEIGTVVGGATPSTKVAENYDGDIPWITPKDLSNFSGRFIEHGERNITQQGFDSCSCQMLPKDSVLFSSRAPIGYVAIAAVPLCTNQGFKSVIPNEKIVDPRFLYYLLKFNKERIAEMGSGTTFMEVSGGVMKNVEVCLPELTVQKRAAEILSSIDDKIELNNRINHNLEEQAQALYKSWFVDFEPFKDGKFIDSEFGMIPDGWRILSFEDFTDLSNERVDSETIPEFSITNNGIFPRDTKFNKQLSSSSLKNKVIRKGDLVFGMSREILNWGIMKEPIGGVSSAYTVYTVDKTLVTPQYLEFFIKNHLSYFKDLIKPAAREGQGIDKTVLSSKLIILPNMDVWERFSLVLDVLIKERLHITSELLELTIYRDELLPALIKGHITC